MRKILVVGLVTLLGCDNPFAGEDAVRVSLSSGHLECASGTTTQSCVLYIRAEATGEGYSVWHSATLTTSNGYSWTYAEADLADRWAAGDRIYAGEVRTGRFPIDLVGDAPDAVVLKVQYLTQQGEIQTVEALVRRS